MKRVLAASAALAAAVVYAVAAPTAPAAPKPYKAGAVKDGGTIRGICKLSGPATPWNVSVFKDNDKGCGENEHKTERLKVGEGNALGNCLVHLKAISSGKEWPSGMTSEDRIATVDQKGCQYVPHVQWLRPETQVVVLNSDRAEHNIHGYRNTLADTQFNFASAPGSKMSEVAAAFLEQTGTYVLKCDIHPWMNAYAFVLEHPYAEVTSEVGTAGRKPGEFVLSDVPPGEYTLVCWHEGFTETPQEKDGKIAAYTYGPDVMLTATVKVDASGTVTHDFEIPAPDAK